MATSSSSTKFMLLLTAFAFAESVRSARLKEIRQPETFTKCKAEGQFGGEGMSITWGSKKALRDCGPTRPNIGEGNTYQFKFTEAFSVSFTSKCNCNIEGKTIVSFTPMNTKQARVCAGTVQEKDPMQIKSKCWEAYMRARGTRFHVAGELSVPEYKVPWLDGHFVVSRGGQCQGDACNSITLPGVIDDMSRDHKRIIGAAIKKIMDKKSAEVSPLLIELIDVLPSDALDDAEFQQIDADGDGTLTLDELTDFYTQFDRDVMDRFIKEIDANGNGTVDPEEFHDLKEKMRTYDPTVDLIDGPRDFLLSDGDIVEPQAVWKVKTVECMKKGKPAPGECEGSETEAVARFNNEC
jgi:hypothetical protein